jgi:hypothetical protein
VTHELVTLVLWSEVFLPIRTTSAFESLPRSFKPLIIYLIMVQQLKNKEEFHNALNANKDKLVVIDFYAQWVSQLIN